MFMSKTSEEARDTDIFSWGWQFVGSTANTISIYNTAQQWCRRWRHCICFSLQMSTHIGGYVLFSVWIGQETVAMVLYLDDVLLQHRLYSYGNALFCTLKEFYNRYITLYLLLTYIWTALLFTFIWAPFPQICYQWEWFYQSTVT